MITRKHLDRRTFLRGLGTAVSLPELLGRAQSAMAIAANPSPLTLAAALYLLFFVPLVVASRWLEGLGPQRH